MEKPTDKQISDVLAGMATPEEGRIVARWFATDDGIAYLSSSFVDNSSSTFSLHMAFFCGGSLSTIS